MGPNNKELGPNPTINSGAADVPDFSAFIGQVTVPVNNYKRCKDVILPLVQQAQTAGKDLTNRQIAEILHKSGYADRILSDSCIRKYIISAEHGSDHVLSDKQIARRRDKMRRHRQQRLDRTQRLDETVITPVRSPTETAAATKAESNDPDPAAELDEVLTDGSVEGSNDTESKETESTRDKQLSAPASGESTTVHQIRSGVPASAESQKKAAPSAADIEKSSIKTGRLGRDEMEAFLNS